MERRAEIVIVGGGAAGIHAARALRGLDELVGVTMVEPTGNHQFLTRLAAVAGGVSDLAMAETALEDLLSCTVLVDSVKAVREGQVLLHSGDLLDADAVILVAGAHATAPPIDGISHTVSLRTAADAVEIRYRAERTDAVVIIGGGPTGCQLAGALASGPFDLFVTLIERESSLLSGFHSSMGQRAREVLTARGVSIWTGRDVQEITPDSVRTANGVAAGVPIWAGGYEARGSALIDAPTIGGRVEVDEFGLVTGFGSVFAAGDVAAHRVDGQLRPMSAQVASKAGKGTAFNALSQTLGRPMKALELNDLGWVVDLSGGRGVADVFGLPLAMPLLDRLVPLIHDAIDVRNMFQIGAVQAGWKAGVETALDLDPATAHR